ncbi:calcium/sodium antiporter [Devosia beringensis]|uniref:calcium/sodium antiporter n=1 Tax=Devosia beringensis TaxID=2657486 RepID=UPI00186B98A8|nr:calcium/sodium antiporter [Devosia beringensis]
MSDGLLILGGLILLIAGAELLVRASSAVAVRLGVSPLIIGLTIVAFGTSAPEVVASVMAALAQSPGIAIGNIVGSNIANGLLVAGAAALVMPIAVSTAALRRDGIVALGAAVLFWLICALGLLNVWAGVVLLAGLVAYIVFAYRSGEAVDAEAAAAPGWPVPAALLAAVAGIVLLAAGGKILVDGAVSLAAGLGVSEAVIGLTIIAVGTSLPELATSLLAAARKQSDIALGNVIGSNIFNVLGIGGLTAMLSSGPIPARLIMVDFPVMLATTVLLLGFAVTGRRIGRVEGMLLVAGFGLYTGTVWLQAAG